MKEVLVVEVDLDMNKKKSLKQIKNRVCKGNNKLKIMLFNLLVRFF